jgi:hypothetical protein
LPLAPAIPVMVRGVECVGELQFDTLARNTISRRTRQI